MLSITDEDHSHLRNGASILYTHGSKMLFSNLSASSLRKYNGRNKILMTLKALVNFSVNIISRHIEQDLLFNKEIESTSKSIDDR